MSINSPGGYSKKNITHCQDDSNPINEKEQKKDKKEKIVKINLDIQNRSGFNLNKSLRKPNLKLKGSFIKKENILNLEYQEKLNKSNRSFLNIDNNLEFPKSSLNVKNHSPNKSYMSGKSLPSHVLFTEGNINNNQKKNQSFHNKGKLNQTKINFLNLINPNHNNRIYNKNKCTNIFNKDLIEALEGDSLNLIQQNLQNKIYDMGKGTEFLEFGKNVLEKPNIFRNQKKKLTVKKTKKELDKVELDTSLKKHKTVIHKKPISNLVNSSTDDLLSDDKSINLKNNMRRRSSKLLLNKLNISTKFKSNLKKSNKHLNNIGNKYYKINVMRNQMDGRRSSFNHFLKSTHSFKKYKINRSKTANHSKIASSIKENISSINNSETSEKQIITKKGININNEKFRILTQKKLVYDSLDDEEMVEDAVFDNFYLYPEDKIIYIIDALTLFLTFWSMIYKPLSLVLNNCDIKDNINSLDFENITNIFIDVLFVCDLIINFFKSFYNFDEQLVTKSEKIFLHYIKGYFIIDLISAIPYYSIIKIISYKNHKNMIMPINCTKYYNHVINDRYQMIELLKLVKLIKCTSSNNIVSNYIIGELNEISFFEDWSFLLSNIFILLLVFHLTACMHIFVASTAFPNWIIQKGLQTSPFFEVYLSSIYFLITTVTSVGYGDIIGSSFTEIIFQIFLLMIGIIAYSWLISSLSNYVQENNKQNEVFHQKLSLLNEIKLEHPKMPKELYDKIYLHLEYINLGQKKDKSSLINVLPHTIQKSLLHEMYKPIIENFNFFKNFKNSEFVNRVISKLKPVLAVKNDLLLEQDEIIEDTIFVKQGRLSLEVKIDAEHPEKSVEKLLNEEYFFGIENNEVYQKSTFGGVFNMTVNNMNQSFVNKKNLYNLYSGNTYNVSNHKRIKSIITNTKGENEILKHPNINNNYIHLRILDIRKNEHFGALLMFLNKRSPLILRVKTKKAELFFLKKIDAVEISTSYPNIWKRVNKKSFHNLKEIKKIMKNIIKHFCETYGIDFDFGTKIYNNLSRININELNKKIIPDLNSNRMLGNKFNILHNRLMDPRRGSVDVYKAQLKMFQHFPKQRQTIILAKTNKEKDIEELVPEKFEINNRLYINKNTNNNNKFEENNIDKAKLRVYGTFKKNDNPIDCDLSIIKVRKKETIYGHGNQNYIKDNNFDNSQNNLNFSQINSNRNSNTNSNRNSKSNSNKNILNKTKKSNLKSKGNTSIKKIIPNKMQYGDEEKNNLMKFFGTPYYPEDINDEIYQGEQMFESISQRNNSEQEFSQINNQFMSYSIEKNNLSKLQKSLIGPIKLNNENKVNNFTINNNFYTHNIINNYKNNKINLDNKLSIHKFNFNITCKINKNKLQIFKNSFQISRLEKFNFKNISSNNLNVVKNGIKNINNKSKNITNKSNEFLIFKNNKSQNNLDFSKTINKISDKKSESYSSSCSSINYESDSDSNNNDNNNENIFECENQTKKADTFKSIKTLKPILKNKKNSIISHNIIENKNKALKIKQTIKINIKPSYLNLNEITKGKFAKSKGLQDCIKNIVIKKILKHKKESQMPKKRKSLGVNRKSLQTLRKLQTLSMPKKLNQSPKRRKSFSVTKRLIQSPQKRRSFSINKKEAISPKKRNTQNSIKLLKNKTIAKNMTKRYSNNIKININNDKIKKTEVKSKFNMISDIHEKSSGNNIIKKDNQIIESNNSSDSTPKKRKNNDEFLLDYVNRNIKDDKAVLNNPDKFYNGLFGAIMKKVNQGKMKQSDEEE